MLGQEMVEIEFTQTLLGRLGVAVSQEDSVGKGKRKG